ncbi:MAG: hypothetical protein A3J29_23180 [Acidobacteria bacterium RIFCSPLOWO2_12_FULL_67_14b]|nr:MAG: hypothetical protein A3I61_13420 [Acidobacteria bacterium RIFCSPLOWO2_02_FULL_68_18]OFW45412.1 MAG: hypothetical protein A3J29_23180 [Acidobacteria bacterium RIFCSPLOWO2_12_FULL_67_14b]
MPSQHVSCFCLKTLLLLDLSEPFFLFAPVLRLLRGVGGFTLKCGGRFLSAFLCLTLTVSVADSSLKLCSEWLKRCVDWKLDELVSRP